MLAMVLLFSCDINTDVDDCSLVLCAGDVSSLNFEVIDAETDENVFVNGTFNIDDVTITDLGGKPIPFSLAQAFAGQQSILALSDPEWSIGSFDYNIMIGENVNFEVTASLERDTLEGCCSNRLFVKSVEISGTSHELQEKPSVCHNFSGMISVHFL